MNNSIIFKNLIKSMANPLFTVLFLACILSVLISACNSNESDIIGVWIDEHGVKLTFTSDGFYIEDLSAIWELGGLVSKGMYTINGNKVRIVITEIRGEELPEHLIEVMEKIAVDQEFRIVRNTLTLIWDGEKHILNRTK